MGNILFPLFIIIIYIRKLLGKEHKKRFTEKFLLSNKFYERNKGRKLIWFHAASIGEVTSIIILIKKLNINKNRDFLITTVTLSSGNLVKKRLENYSNVFHHYFPLDVNFIIKKFLNKWRPDLVIFTDSEIWPNFLFKIKEKNIPLLLINARITQKTFMRWKRISNFAEKVFNNFDLCLAASKESEINLKELKVKNVKYNGNLKFAADITIDKINDENKKILNNFKVWCAASTHKNEEIFCLNTHKKVKNTFKNIITIIIPRHISRVKEIENISNSLGLSTQILNDEEKIKLNAEIIIVNSFGVISRYFNYCKSVFIGKSLVKELKAVGGQNPIEAAKLGCKIYHGSFIYNFQEVYDFLKLHNICEEIIHENDLSNKIINDFTKNKDINKNNIKIIEDHGIKILTKTINQINFLIK